jgi:hypothetical protein
MIWRESRTDDAFSPASDSCACQSHVKPELVAAACRGFPTGLMGMPTTAL